MMELTVYIPIMVGLISAALSFFLSIVVVDRRLRGALKSALKAALRAASRATIRAVLSIFYSAKGLGYIDVFRPSLLNEGPCTPDPWTLDVLRVFKYRLELRFGNRVEAIYLFGSRARGDYRFESDADVAVFFAGSLEYPFGVEKEMIHDIYRLLLEHGLYISAHAFEATSLQDPGAHRYPHLLRAVLRDGIVV